jgi:hypothetical protein
MFLIWLGNLFLKNKFQGFKLWIRLVIISAELFQLGPFMSQVLPIVEASPVYSMATSASGMQLYHSGINLPGWTSRYHGFTLSTMKYYLWNW